MWLDFLLIAYIVLLLPFINLCEKMSSGGLKCLLIGIFLTPVAGYVYMKYFYKNTKFNQHTPA
jgi:hypothetical protein